jgi:branched-chain amino acid aminotransferase
VAQKGHQQALWLYGNQIVEVGSSNIFFAFKDSQSGQIEIATPALEDLILPGVTRDSILVLFC